MNKDSKKDFQELELGNEIVLDDLSAEENRPSEPVFSVKKRRPFRKPARSPKLAATPPNPPATPPPVNKPPATPPPISNSPPAAVPPSSNLPAPQKLEGVQNASSSPETPAVVENPPDEEPEVDLSKEYLAQLAANKAAATQTHLAPPGRQPPAAQPPEPIRPPAQAVGGNLPPPPTRTRDAPSLAQSPTNSGFQPPVQLPSAVTPPPASPRPLPKPDVQTVPPAQRSHMSPATSTPPAPQLPSIHSPPLVGGVRSPNQPSPPSSFGSQPAASKPPEGIGATPAPSRPPATGSPPIAGSAGSVAPTQSRPAVDYSKLSKQPPATPVNKPLSPPLQGADGAAGSAPSQLPPPGENTVAALSELTAKLSTSQARTEEADTKINPPSPSHPPQPPATASPTPLPEVQKAPPPATPPPSAAYPPTASAPHPPTNPPPRNVGSPAPADRLQPAGQFPPPTPPTTPVHPPIPPPPRAAEASPPPPPATGEPTQPLTPQSSSPPPRVEASPPLVPAMANSAPTALDPLSVNALTEADVDRLVRPPAGESSEGAIQAKPIQNMPRVSRTFLLFCLLTCCIFVGTIILLVVKFWPSINNALQSNRQEEESHFEDVLAHLLQVDNQNMEISFVYKKSQDILPRIGNEDIALAEISLNNDVQIDYLTEAFRPNFNANLDFDLKLQSESKSNNTSLAVSTLFEGQEAYFKINQFCIDDCRQLRLDDQYLQRWSNLHFLLAGDQGSEGLSENKSRILSYLVALLNEYPTHRDLVLLPVFNIQSSRQYIEVKKLLLESQIYELNSGGCQMIKAQEMSCPLKINYTSLYNFYRQVYVDILKEELPSYYAVLENPIIPNQFKIIFDTKEHLPRQLLAANDSLDLSISYSKFDSMSFELESATSIVSLREYYQQILKAEEQIYVQ